MTLSAPPAVIDNEAEKWQEIAERMSDGFVALDRAWRYTYVNSRGAQLLEREAAELIGKHIWTEFPASVDQPFYEACQRVMIDQVPQTIEYQFGPQGRWMETRIFPSAQGVNLFFADRTGRKASQMAIAQTSLRLRAIVDHAALGITQIDARSGAIEKAPM